MSMPPMLAFSILSSQNTGGYPYLFVGQSPRTVFTPAKPQDDSYWYCILDANNPTHKVMEFMVPGSSNHTVPDGLDAFMSNPSYITVLATTYLSTLHVPQGDLYNYLAKHGASRELQRLEQINTSLGCGHVTRVSYVLTTQGGTVGYENGGTIHAAQILMSLMPRKDGTPPYSLCDTYTFIT